MANIKITELNELATVATDDILPIVDISTNETKKIKLSNLLNSAILLKGFIPNNTDLNNFITNGIYCTGNSTLSNMPSNIDYAWGFVIVIYQNNVVQQFFIKPVQGSLYMRENSGVPAQWSSWRQISVI